MEDRSQATIVTNNGSELLAAPLGYNNGSYFSALPPGYRFKPLDEELVLYYLKRKIANQALPPNRITDVELYKFSPDNLAERYHDVAEGAAWYFFTPREKKYPNGARPSRSAGDGYWKATGADRNVIHNSVVVGFRKSLVFYTGKASKGKKTDWMMHEFRVNDDSPRKRNTNNMRLDEWVLCKIYKKNQTLKVADQSRNNGIRVLEQSNSGSTASDVEPQVSEIGDNHMENPDETLRSNPISYSYNNCQSGSMNTTGYFQEQPHDGSFDGNGIYISTHHQNDHRYKNSNSLVSDKTGYEGPEPNGGINSQISNHGDDYIVDPNVSYYNYSEGGVVNEHGYDDGLFDVEQSSWYQLQNTQLFNGYQQEKEGFGDLSSKFHNENYDQSIIGSKKRRVY